MLADQLPPDIDAYIQHELATGQYASKDELVLDALRIHQVLSERHRTLREDIERAVGQIERGEGIELSSDEELREFFDDIKARGRERLAAEQRLNQ